MLLKSLFTAAFLAASVNAAAVATPGKSFKFQVDDPKKGKFYLADATGVGTQDASKALTCELTGEVITCGGKGFGNYMGDMVKLATSGSSSGWSIDSSDNIHWSAKANIKFSIGIGSNTDIWAETCPDSHQHFAGQHGTAKAIWV
ncbi:hypothetical protein GQ53DRAFT_766871 [Thozetella sp. PMI_491]|nr:hypothetical protein GQ53DRAFT_766871 [Thozetella sp. PMI_491]